MNIDMQRLFREHSISTDGKHKEPGWLNVRCPFCDDKGNHLGWNVRSQYFNCYRCGAHRVEDTLAELLSMPEREVWVLVKQYGIRPSTKLGNDKPEIMRPDAIIVPGTSLQKMHRDYLIGRGYDPDRLAIWQLQGTGHAAEGTNKFRIICPVYHDGRVVSWQGRDITGRSPLRWKSCPKELELRDHKHCLGGSQLVPGDSVAVVEGFTDAWRLGPGAVCTFGTDYLLVQVNLLRRYHRRFHILDSREKDPNAIVQADKLANMCSVFPGEDIIVELDNGDPGDLVQAEADYLMETEWGVR